MTFMFFFFYWNHRISGPTTSKISDVNSWRSTLRAIDKRMAWIGLDFPLYSSWHRGVCPTHAPGEMNYFFPQSHGKKHGIGKHICDHTMGAWPPWTGDGIISFYDSLYLRWSMLMHLSWLPWSVIPRSRWTDILEKSPSTFGSTNYKGSCNIYLKP
jgi:hypothetical protein